MTDRNPSPDTWRLYATDETEATVVLQVRRQALYPQRFLTMFPHTFAQLGALDRPPAYFRALVTLLAVLDPVQWRTISAREVAELSKMAQSSAERALALLEADGVILAKGRSAAKRRRLNNRLAWAAKATLYPDGSDEREALDPEVTDARGR